MKGSIFFLIINWQSQMSNNWGLRYKVKEINNDLVTTLVAH